jgi:hypothetical protein
MPRQTARPGPRSLAPATPAFVLVRPPARAQQATRSARQGGLRRPLSVRERQPARRLISSLLRASSIGLDAPVTPLDAPGDTEVGATEHRVPAIAFPKSDPLDAPGAGDASWRHFDRGRRIFGPSQRSLGGERPKRLCIGSRAFLHGAVSALHPALVLSPRSMRCGLAVRTILCDGRGAAGSSGFGVASGAGHGAREF